MSLYEVAGNCIILYRILHMNIRYDCIESCNIYICLYVTLI